MLFQEVSHQLPTQTLNISLDCAHTDFPNQAFSLKANGIWKLFCQSKNKLLMELTISLLVNTLVLSVWELPHKPELSNTKSISHFMDQLFSNQLKFYYKETNN